MPCPTCGTPCQKVDGCNHVQCSGCRAHFSWLPPESFDWARSAAAGLQQCEQRLQRFQHYKQHFQVWSAGLFPQPVPLLAAPPRRRHAIGNTARASGVYRPGTAMPLSTHATSGSTRTALYPQMRKVSQTVCRDTERALSKRQRRSAFQTSLNGYKSPTLVAWTGRISRKRVMRCVSVAECSPTPTCSLSSCSTLTATSRCASGAMVCVDARTAATLPRGEAHMSALQLAMPSHSTREHVTPLLSKLAVYAKAHRTTACRT